MFDIFKTYLASKIPITDQQWSRAEEHLSFKNARRGEILVSKTDIPYQGMFVMKGCLRNYMIKDGKEHIIQFAPEHWWMGANHAVPDPEPSSLYIQAIEDSRIALFDFNFIQILVEEAPGFLELRQQLQQKAFRNLELRVGHLLSSSAEERYTYFISTYPGLATRLPLKMIASYLGMAPQSLSRIRSNYIGGKVKLFPSGIYQAAAY
jgi:CRP-like cAMP-binding protein